MQVNTLAAEKLYSLAGDWAGLDADTLLFDVCCGTGTIGLTLAHRVGMVIISYHFSYCNSSIANRTRVMSNYTNSKPSQSSIRAKKDNYHCIFMSFLLRIHTDCFVPPRLSISLTDFQLTLLTFLTREALPT